MADMKKVYDDLTITDLYYRDQREVRNWSQDKSFRLLSFLNSQGYTFKILKCKNNNIRALQGYLTS